MSSDASRLNSNPRLKPPLRKQGAAKWLFRLILLAVLAAAGLIAHRHWFAPRLPDRNLPTALVVRSNLPITLSANASVQPEQLVNVSPKTAGILTALLVEEGDVVQKGQIVAYMDDSNLQGQWVEAKGKLEAAKATLQKLEAGNRPQEIEEAQAKLAEAKFRLREAELTLSQDEQLFGDGAISQRDLESSRAARDTALAQVMQFQQALSLVESGTRIEEIAEARAEVIAAEGTLQNMQTQLNDMVIRAPFTGVVVRKFADPGAFVTPNTTASAEFSATSSSILSLASENRVIANVSETNIAKIQKGQSVIISADAYPDQIFSGKVSEIAPQSTVEMNVTTFEVKITLADPQGRLRSGMNADVEFQVGHLDNALVIPAVAVVREAAGTGVYVAGTDRRPVFKPIQTGVTVGSVTEIQSGLQEGEEVLIGMPQSEDSAAQPSLLQGPPPGGPGAPPGL